MRSFEYVNGSRRVLAVLVVLFAIATVIATDMPLVGKTVSPKKKHVIGSTARMTEVSTGVEFAARVDTGAKSCSIHVEKWEIKDPAPKPLDNIGKSIRFLVANDEGESEWVETIVAGRVRIRNSAQNDGAYHGRYKVRLTLQWQGFKKEVFVTLTDRAGMEYPLLLGRNFLRDDFLVDVSLDSDD
jgi:hypothetical protein